MTTTTPPPPTLVNAWTGIFESQTYNYIFTMVKGTINVDLPDDVTQTQTNATLTYTGLYKRNTVFTMFFKYASPSLIGTCTDSTQTIEFTPTFISTMKITGKYTSHNPYDVGTFVLNRV